MTYTYKYPQASPTSVLLIFSRAAGKIRLMTTIRDKTVGEGFSLSAGGFDAVKDSINKPGLIKDGREETYREARQELGEGLKKLIPYEEFKKRVQYLWDGTYTTKTGHPHKVVARTLEVSNAELDEMISWPRTSEQKGKVIEEFIDTKEGICEARAQLPKWFARFRNPDEVYVAGLWLESLENAA